MSVSGGSGGSGGAGLSSGGGPVSSGGAPILTGGAAGLGMGGSSGAMSAGSPSSGGAPLGSGGTSLPGGGHGGSTGGGTATGGAVSVAGAAGAVAGGAGSAATGGAAGGSAGSAGASAGSSSAGAAGSDIPCPAGATFCSGFEGQAFPSGTMFHAVGPNSEGAYAFDTAQSFAGKQSFSIPESSGGFYYRALAVPVPGQNFWVRLYVRVSRAFGDNGHDSLFGVSTGALSADVNNEALVEFSEQFDKILLNTDDQLFTPADSNKLAADMWHCIEAHYDGGSGDVQIFAGNKEIIHATGYAKKTFQTFRLGYMQYHDTRAVWYDNVVVAPSRVGCD